MAFFVISLPSKEIPPSVLPSPELHMLEQFAAPIEDAALSSKREGFRIALTVAQAYNKALAAGSPETRTLLIAHG